jgi:hypothetical protein
VGAGGTAAEYGDLFSDMGNQFVGHYAAYQKADLLHWMAPSVNYAVVQNSGTWTLQPVEASPAGLQALKVQRGTNNNAWLWIEYRRPIGLYDSSFSNLGQPYTGALIHYDDGTGSLASNLLDFGPLSTGFYTPALAAGQTWADPYTNVSINVQSATASGLTVSVQYGAAPCTHANPTVGLSPANPTASAGSSVNYAVSVTNNDASGCAPSTFNLTSTQPGGWVGTFSPVSLTLNPGQSASAALTETVPAAASAATYSVTALAAGGSYTGSAAANCTVAASSNLTNALSAAGTAYSARQTISLKSAVLNGGVPVSGAAVIFTLKKANGATVSGKTTTDATGTAAWSYRLGQKDPSGVYSVQSSATYKSTVAMSNTVTFTVQ